MSFAKDMARKAKRAWTKRSQEQLVQREAAKRGSSSQSEKMSLREICTIMGVPVPKEYEQIADEKFTEVSCSAKRSRPGCIQFIYNAKEEEGQKAAVQGRKQGSAFFVAPYQVFDEKGKPLPCIVIKHPRGHFINVCAIIKRGIDIPTIAVTGSVGKTTTKDMLREVIATQYKILASQGNSNGLAPVAHYVQSITPKHEVLLQEAGLYSPGCLDRAGAIIQPNAFIVTNIGMNHVKEFGSQEGILKEKLSFDAHLPHNGIAFLNYDDPLLAAAKLKHRVVSYALDRTDVDYYATDIAEAEGIISFKLVEASTGFVLPARVHAFGRHNAYNAVCAFAVARWLKVDPENIARGLDSYRSKGLRQNFQIIGGQKVFIDCYNASEVAAKSSSEALCSISPGPGGKRIFVFADIDDKLGAYTEEIHRRVGVQLAGVEGINQLVFYGEHAAWAAEEAEKLGARVFKTCKRSELNAFLKETLKPEDVIGFKGGQHKQLSKTIDSLFGTAYILEDGDMLGPQTAPKYDERDGTYRLIEDYGAEYFCYPMREARTATEKAKRKGLGPDCGLSADQIRELEEVVIPSSYRGETVLIVGKMAFIGSRNIRRAHLEEGIRTIADRAFRKASELESVELPHSLRVICQEAFKDCTSLESLVIPEGVTTIGESAFANCAELADVWLPNSLKTAAANMFEGSAKVTVHCNGDSWAAGFMREHCPQVKLELND